MIKLLIIADDFTGALDSGVQFAEEGISTCVVTDVDINFACIEKNTQVLALDAETRHLDQHEAFNVVKKLAQRAREAGVPFIYKKTDSALRGNIGAELAALCESTGERIHFIPAFPQMGRITKNGILYVDGQPVSNSVFGKDLFEPVHNSLVADVIKEQTDCPVFMVKQEIPAMSDFPKGILVYDSTKQSDLLKIGNDLLRENELHYCAGCAGFASVMSKIMDFTKGEKQIINCKDKLLVVCGSMNPITVDQLDAAELSGIQRFRLTAEQKIDASWPNSEDASKHISQWINVCNTKGACILDSNDRDNSLETKTYCDTHRISINDMRTRIVNNMGLLVKRILDDGLDATLMLTGGDTLMGFMEQVGVNSLKPLCQLAPGTVMSELYYKEKQYYIISKSGGFGRESILKELKDYIQK